MIQKITIIILILVSFSTSVFAKEASLSKENIDKTSITYSKEKYNHYTKNASLQILNKITAKITNISTPVGGEYIYSNLRIRVLACWKSAEYDLLENKILISVFETKNGTTENIFKGWLFSSSPAISSIEHPVYDIVALACYN